MLKTLIVFEEESEWGYIFHQELWDPDKKLFLANIRNLDKCPEEAIIGRALCDSDDVTYFIKCGIQYAKEGYDSIKLIYVSCPKDINLQNFIENYLNEWKPVQEKE